MAGDLTVRVAGSIAAINRERWNACANPTAGAGPSRDSELAPVSGSRAACDGHGVTPASPRPALHANEQGEGYNPFISHEFLSSLEASGAVSARTGWAPAHLVVENAAGDVLGCVAAYLKSHSMGEYVFDHSWADAFMRAGGQYYPKLQVSVPFTPVTGRRLLVAPGPRTEAARAGLLGGLATLRQQTEASSIHATFLQKSEFEVFAAAGFLRRTDQQFHFFNDGYGSFDDFLTALASRKRKMIRRERREAVAAGITVEWVTGRDITERHWDAFFAFYMDTGSRKWGRPYLNRKFFSLVGAAMPERILLVMARRAGRTIAGALNFIGDDALYGRNWGAIEHHPFLHFEVCYYQAIEFAIARKLARVEAGAQGEHKLARGYRPAMTYSAHAIADPRLRRAIADYLVRERLHVEETQEILADHIPFRRDAEQEVDTM
ncbi:MAG: N-acetyltransferase [Methylobacteriaceae bacterium]|nr:N-acetyltransferase [Methylobacteriaceae bacterium]